MSQLDLIIPTVVHHFRDLGLHPSDLGCLTRRDLYDGAEHVAAIFRAGEFLAVSDKSRGEIRFYDHRATRLKTIRSQLLTASRW